MVKKNLVVFLGASIVTSSCSSNTEDKKSMLIPPAYEYCTKNGHKIENILRDTGLIKKAFCIDSGGTSCELWAYYRGECKLGK